MNRSETNTGTASPAPARIQELDAVRGFAMCGIVFVNIAQITGMPRGPVDAAANHAGLLFDLTVYERFYPIFSFLFGLSFAIFISGARQRHDRPWLVAVRRLVALGLIGLLHTLLQPGEVLRFYAVFALVFLLPASFLSRRWILGLGFLGLIPSYFLGGTFAIPGLFLLGMATQLYDVPATIARRSRALATLLVVAAALAVAGGYWQYLGGVGWGNRGRIFIAGLAFVVVYLTGFLLLLRTPLRQMLLVVFEKLGRMALTNYLLATVLIVAADAFLHLGSRPQYLTVLWLGIAIGAIQSVLSHLVMRSCSYGPVEWVWRCVTWWSIIPFLRGPAPGRSAAPPTERDPTPRSAAVTPEEQQERR